MKNPLRLFICAMMICAATAQEPAAEGSVRTISDAGLKSVTAIAYDRKGQFLVVGIGDNSIRLYDVRPGDRLTAELTQTLTGHSAAILAMGFDGTNSLVSVSADQTSKIWDITSGSLRHSVELNFGKQLVPALAPGNEPFLAGGTLKQVRLWNYQTGELLKSFEANDSNVAALAFTPDGKLLVIGTTKGVVRVMDVAAWKVTRTMDLDTPVYSLAVSMSHVILGYGDGTVAMLNLNGDQPSVPERKAQTERINAVAFSATGNRFISVSSDKSIKLWDTEEFTVLGSLERQSGESSIAFSPDGRTVAFRGADGRLHCWTVP